MCGIDTVDGSSCLVSVGNRKTWVPFRSHSDALLANLALQHNMTWGMLDGLLNVLSNSRFNPSEISLRRAIDLDRRIAQHRYEETVAYRQRQITPSKLRVSTIVVEAVADYFSEHIYNSSRIMTKVRSWTAPLFDVSLKDTLQTMTLVHRTWTGPAQRALRKNVFLDGFDMRRFIRHPFCGPWIRELRFRDEGPPHDYSETLVQLSSVLTLAPSITDLYVKICVMRKVRQFSNFLEAVQSLPFLKRLHISCFIPYGDLLQFEGDEFPKLDDLYDALPNMSRLEWLTLTGWQHNRSSRNTPLPERFRVTTPPASLKTIAFSDDEMRIPSEYISWLINARGEFQPKCLRLGGREDPSSVPRLLEAAQDSLSALETLELHCLNQGDFYTEELKPHIDKCTTLRMLILNATGSGRFDLPSSIEILVLTSLWSSAAIRDLFLSLSDKFPPTFKLRKLILPPLDAFSSDPYLVSFDMLRSMCEQKGIEVAHLLV